KVGRKTAKQTFKTDGSRGDVEFGNATFGANAFQHQLELLRKVGRIGTIHPVEFFRQVLRLHVACEFVLGSFALFVGVVPPVRGLAASVRLRSFDNSRGTVFGEKDFPFLNEHVVRGRTDRSAQKISAAGARNQGETPLISVGNFSQPRIFVGGVDPEIGRTGNINDGVI